MYVGGLGFNSWSIKNQFLIPQELPRVTPSTELEIVKYTCGMENKKQTKKSGEGALDPAWSQQRAWHPVSSTEPARSDP